MAFYQLDHYVLLRSTGVSDSLLTLFRSYLISRTEVVHYSISLLLRIEFLRVWILFIYLRLLIRQNWCSLRTICSVLNKTLGFISNSSINYQTGALPIDFEMHSWLMTYGRKFTLVDFEYKINDTILQICTQTRTWELSYLNKFYLLMITLMYGFIARNILNIPVLKPLCCVFVSRLEYGRLSFTSYMISRFRLWKWFKEHFLVSLL